MFADAGSGRNAKGVNVTLPCCVLIVMRVAAVPFTSIRTPGISIGAAGWCSGASSHARNTNNGPRAVFSVQPDWSTLSPGRGCQLRIRRMVPPITVALPSHFWGAWSLMPNRTLTVRTEGSNSAGDSPPACEKSRPRCQPAPSSTSPAIPAVITRVRFNLVPS